ncbi:hypothetical protein JGU71_11590 [Antrihabitans sp. YC3-6]|uniref:LGFP repeat-containing protein n=1 Tax=Antrihabitans stalagmiti TaxID=2799499 RepID=A0A934NQL3_9NOCA|nr:hypothetical protein [Antrihabitans stalagmiti]MBJ8339529.1 hypothetical protein [Antrihabitans stalagmiti]
MHSPINTFVRAFAVAGIITGTTLFGFTTASAGPAEPGVPTVAVAGNCQSYWPSPYQVCAEIRDLYNSIGGPSGSLSFPKAAEFTNPDGSKYQTFINGTIAWTAATGAYVS